MAASAASPGKILAQSPDGRRLRCDFTYSDDSGAGFGVCYDERGAAYDLLID